MNWTAASRCAPTTDRNTSPATDLPDCPPGMGLSHAFPHQPEANGVVRAVFPHLEGAGGASARIFRTAAEVRAAVSEFRHTLTSAGASLGSASAGPTTTGRDTPLHQTCSWQHGDPDVRLESTDPAVPTWVMPGKRAQGRSSKAAGLRASGSCLTEPSTLAFSFQSGTLLKLLSETSAECGRTV